VVRCSAWSWAILARPRRMFIVSRIWLPLDLPRSTSIMSGRRSQLQRQCKPSASAAPGVTPLHEDLRGSSWIVCGTTWIRHPALAIGGVSWTLALSSTSSTRPQLEEAVLNGLLPWNTPLFPRLLSY
jgi:hypothetical protein